jgi:Kdo2-lipid IVA lauroyltransferase/acyltransferase
MTKHILDIILLCLLRFVFFFFRVLPRPIAERFSFLLVRLILFFMPRHRYVAFRNMDVTLPGMSPDEKEALLNKNYMIMAKNIISLARGKYLDRESVLQSLDTSQAEGPIKTLMTSESKVGTLFLTPHFGSFENLALFWGLYDRPFSILARGFGLPLVDAWWNTMRSAHGNRVFNRKGGYNSIISELKKGENVAILFDQNVKPNHAAFVPFFGTFAATTKSTAIASIRTSCPIVLAAMVETTPGHYKLYVFPIKKPAERSGSQEEKIYATIREAHQHLEEIIRKYPEQWFWIHRRFKTRPKGEAETMYDPALHPA